jgi:replicative DNA helicase
MEIDKSKIISTKLPPASIELEKVILGAMMIDKTGLEEAMLIIPTADVFYKDEHKAIFQAIQRIYNAGEGIDLLTVSDNLKKYKELERAGGDFYLIQLTQMISSSAHIEYHSRIILQAYMKRQIIFFSSQNISLAYDDSTDVFDLLRGWQKAFDGIQDYISTGRNTMSFPAALQNLKESVELLSKNKNEVKLVGIDTGFNIINKSTGGYRNQDLVVIAARPGMGKTSYVLKCAIENCKKNIGVGFISLEMSVEQLTARAVAIDTNFHLVQLLKKGFEKVEYFNTYSQHQDRMNSYPLYIDDSGKCDITDIVITAKLWQRKYGIKVLIIDYIQLMNDKSVKGNREAEISSVSRRLKRLAKELNIPVIALSQLSRQCETRGSSKRPLLSDLRDSGAIEQDADIVEFLYRPSYYKIDIESTDYDSPLDVLVSAGADTEVIFAKYRAGSTGTTLLKWVGDKTKFVDVDDVMERTEYIGEELSLPKPTANEAFGSNGVGHNHFM